MLRIANDRQFIEEREQVRKLREGLLIKAVEKMREENLKILGTTNDLKSRFMGSLELIETIKNTQKSKLNLTNEENPRLELKKAKKSALKNSSSQKNNKKSIKK